MPPLISWIPRGVFVIIAITLVGLNIITSVIPIIDITASAGVGCILFVLITSISSKMLGLPWNLGLR